MRVLRVEYWVAKNRKALEPPAPSRAPPMPSVEAIMNGDSAQNNNVPYDWGDVEYYQDAAAAMYEDCPDNEPWGD